MQGAATWRIQCDDRATLQGVTIPSAMLKIVFLPYFNFWGFFNAVWALTSGGFRIVSDTPTIATFYFGEIGVSSVCCEKLVIAQKYSSKVRPNFSTHSAPSDKTLASAKHYKGMFGAILVSTTIYSTTPNTILDLLTVDNDRLLVK